MLSRDPRIDDISDLSWERLGGLAFAHENLARRVVLLHRQGRALACWDTQAGRLPLPVQKVEDAQALAESLKAAHPEALEAWVVEPEALRAGLAKAQMGLDLGLDLDLFLRHVWEQRMQGSGLGLAPRREFMWYGLPMARLQKFCDSLLPERCCFTLAAFEGQALWAGLLAEFEGPKLVGLHTLDALPQAELSSAQGIEAAPFLLALVSNTLQRPAFGWFVERADLEAWMRCPDADAKAEIFQRSILERRSYFDAAALMPGAGRAESLKPIPPAEG
jgi:hypothetical protein